MKFIEGLEFLNFTEVRHAIFAKMDHSEILCQWKDWVLEKQLNLPWAI